MFENLERLDFERHKGLRFKPARNFGFATSLASAPLSASEMVDAAKHYPIVFSTEGPLLPVAMLSLKGGDNAFVDDRGDWLASYVPMHVARYPFILGDTENLANFVVMIDRAAPHFAADDGEPLFTEDGEYGPTLAKAREFLKAFQSKIVATQELLAPLAETGVLTMQRLDLERSDGTKALIEGVRAVDQKKLAELDDATLAGWVRSGLIVVITTHLGSLKNFASLAERQGVIRAGAA